MRPGSRLDNPMNAKSTVLLIAAVALLGQSCHTDKARSAPTESVAQVSKIAPSGWQVTTTNDTITLRRNAPVWIMGYISRPGQSGTKEEFFKKEGSEIHYELRLRFVSLLSQPEYKRLKAARGQAAARLRLGAPGKSEYTELQRQYEECQVPRFYTEDYSVFVDRWAENGHRLEPLFVEIYPPEAASEIDGIVKSLSRVFKEYDESEA
jgi:hypothetical protein